MRNPEVAGAPTQIENLTVPPRVKSPERRGKIKCLRCLYFVFRFSVFRPSEGHCTSSALHGGNGGRGNDR